MAGDLAELRGPSGCRGSAGEPRRGPSDVGAAAPGVGSRPVWAEIDLGAVRHNASLLRRRGRAGRAVRGGQGRRVRARRGGGGAGRARRGRRRGWRWPRVEEGVALLDAGITAPVLVLSEPPPEAMADVVGRGLTPDAVLAPRRAPPLAQASARAGVGHRRPREGGHGHAPRRRRSGRAGRDRRTRWRRSRRCGSRRCGPTSPSPTGPATEDRSSPSARSAASTRPATCSSAAGHAPPMLHAANSAGALAYPAVAPRHGAVRDRPLRGLPVPRARRRCSPTVMAAPARRACARCCRWRAKVTVRASSSTPASDPRTAGSRRSRVPLDGGDGAPRLRRRRAPALLHRGRYRARGRPAPPVGRDGHDGPDRGGLRSRGAAWRWATTWCSSASRATESLTATDWAEVLGTIAHEVFCGIGARVPRVVVDGEGRRMSERRAAVPEPAGARRRRRHRRGAGGGVGGASTGSWPARGPPPTTIASEGLTVPDDCTTMWSTPTTGAPSTSSSAARAHRWCCCTGSC